MPDLPNDQSPEILPPNPRKAAPPPKVKGLVGRSIGGFEILEWLGRGGMGAVYKARQVSLDRLVAFKVIGEGIQRNEGLLNRFQREAKTVARFNSSRIVQVFDVGFDQGIHFISMEYIPGGDLKARTRALGRIAPEEAIIYIREAAEGLLAAERQGIIHRDLKPENLMLDASGEIKITDFGLAKAVQKDASLTQTGDYLGTPVYMSPEQAHGNPLDHRSDIYSLGATFFFILSGVPPYTGETVYEILRKKTEFESLDPGLLFEKGFIPEGISRIIRRMTALQPKDRYPSFEDLVEDIDRYLERSTAASRMARRRFRRLSAALVLLAALVGGGYYALKRSSPGEWRAWFSSAFGEAVAIEERPPADHPPAATPAPEVNAGFVKSEERPVEPAPVEPPPADPPPSPPSPTPPEDLIREEMEKLRRRLRSCGDLLVQSDAARVLESIPPDAHPELRQALLGLGQDAGFFSEVKNLVLNLREIKVLPPFEELSAAWGELRGRLEPPPGSGPELRECLAREAAKLSRGLEERAEVAAKGQVELVELSREQFQKGGMKAAEFRQQVEALERSRTSLLALFPEKREAWDRAIPESRLAALRKDLIRRKDADEEVRSVGAAIRKLESLLEGVKRAGDWTANLEATLSGEVDRIGKGIQALREMDREATLGAEEELFEKVRKRKERWKEHLEVFRQARGAIEARRTGETLRLVQGLKGDGLPDRDAESLGLAAEAIDRGFKALLSGLDLDAARGEFSAALERLKGASVEFTFPRQCLERLEELRSLAIPGMTPVLAGQVKVRSSRPAGVEAFFIDRREVSIRKYRGFVEEMKKVRSFEEVKGLWPSEVEFQRDAGEPRYLASLSNLDEDWPIEAVNYHQARAFLKRLEKDLPTVEEWWLAAKGKWQTGHRRLPCEPWNINKSGHPLPVDQGGVSVLYSRPHNSLHHLSGNVAEWTRLRGTGSRAEVMGGSYRDDNDAVFAGELPEELQLLDTRRGYGFRGVIRPREFFQGLLPE